jgi:Ca2+-binding EF-hand superfamily protein
MIRYGLRGCLVTAAALAALVPLLSPAGDEPSAAKNDAPVEGSQLDIVYFAETRPILIRLHIEIDGRAFDDAYDDYIAALFKFLDRDGDGLLSPTEAARAPTPQALVQALGGNVNRVPVQQNPNDAAEGKPEIETNEEGKVTVDALARFYRKNGAGPVRVTDYPPQAAAAAELTDALFELLDTNRDGKLSQQELASAEKKILKLDANEDDLVSAEELVPGIRAKYAPPMQPEQLVLQDPNAKKPPPPPESNFFVVVPDGSPRLFSARLELARKIIARYDKNGDGRLSRTEVSFLAEFNLLDRNKDGFLDSTELMRFLALDGDVEVTLRIGKNEASKALAQVVAPRGKNTRMAKDVTTSIHGSAKFENRATEIDIRGVEGARANQYAISQAFLDTFRAVDTERAGFVTRKQVENPQFGLLSSIFALADRNDDGRLSERELREYIDLQSKAGNAFIRISIADNANGLFGLLDSNHDGHLGIRELRTAWERLKKYDQDFDQCISRKELPHQFRILVSRGEPIVNGPLLGATSPPAAGPLWFRLMDRNGDGDVSAREFPGTAEEFKRLDLDDDGLISIEEAIKADETMRKR